MMTFRWLGVLAICAWAADVKTGPAIGSKIPAFEAIDQNGIRQTFQSLKGPHGLALLFVRSADW